MTKPEKRTILVVEDDEGFRRSVVSFLADSGFQMLHEARGDTGLERALKERPDLVLSDLRMPGMGGMEMLAAIRAAQPELPVIIISGTADKPLLTDTLTKGATAYMTKPIADLAELEALVRRVLATGAP